MFKILLSISLLVCLCGCGHNAFQLVDGKYGNVGYDPQLQKFGLQYGNGLAVSLVQKDNAKFQLEETDTLDVNGRITSKTTKIKYEIQEQITQADVDHAKVSKK